MSVLCKLYRISVILSTKSHILTLVDRIYVVGGQLFLNSNMTNADQIIYLGASVYEEGNSTNNASIRFNNGNTIAGQVILVEDTQLNVYNTSERGTIAGEVTLNGHQVTKTGNGTVVLQNVVDLNESSFAINGGTLRIGNSGNYTISSLSGSGTSVFDISGDSSVTIEALTGSGTLTLSGAAADYTLNDFSAFSGNLALSNTTLNYNDTLSQESIALTLSGGSTLAANLGTDPIVINRINLQGPASIALTEFNVRVGWQQPLCFLILC